MGSEATTIQVSKETRDELRGFGIKGETYDIVIQKLMKVARKAAFYREIDRILETEEFVPLDKI